VTPDAGLPLYTGPLEMNDGAGNEFTTVGSIPADYPTELIPPGATAQVKATQGKDTATGYAIFADTASYTDLIRHYVGVIIAHGGSISEAKTDTDYGLNLWLNAPDLTLFIHAFNGLVSIQMNSPLNPDEIHAQVPYPTDLPESMLPTDVLTMDMGGVEGSLQIYTLDPAKTLIAKANALYKSLGATDISIDNGDGEGSLMRGTAKGKVLMIWVVFGGLITRLEVSKYDPI